MPIEHRLHERCAGVAAASIEHSSGARPFAWPSTQHHFERDCPFEIPHLTLHLTLDVDQKSVVAKATLLVRRIDSKAEELALDAVGFEVENVEVDGARARWHNDGRQILIGWKANLDTARVDVTYSATPRRGLYFLKPDAQYPDRPRQVWSQCQEEDARHWFPCHDSPHLKMTTEIVARVPHGWYALSNGVLTDVARPASGLWTYHWKMQDPVPSYLVTLAAGEFDEVTDFVTVGGRDVPLTYLVPRARAGDASRTFGHTPQMVAHFSDVTGVAFPWTKYAQVVVSDFIFGGMENTTATTLYEHVMLDERAALDVSSDDLIAHELAHHWFGDFVTCRAWHEAWLNEGFATFFEHVWREKHLGRDEYAYGLKGDLDAYVGEAQGRYRRAIVCQDYDAPLDLFDRHLYEKGGLVLHLLRNEVGNDRFWNAVTLYLESHAHGTVETRDLQAAMEQVSGRRYGRFFEQWLYRPGHPEIEIEIRWDKGLLLVSAEQRQSPADGVPQCFELALELDIADERDAVMREAVRVTERKQSFAIPCTSRPAFVVVDPEGRILGELRLKVAADMLRRQLVHAPTARGRWTAAAALSVVDEPATIEILGNALLDEKEFWGTRVECAAALGKLRTQPAFDLLVEARRTPSHKVRRAVVDALGHFRSTQAADAIRPHAMSDPSYLVEAEAARALGRTRQPSMMDTLVALLERPSWYDVIRAGAADGLAALRDERALGPIGAQLPYGRPPRARRAAILSLAKLGSDRKTRETLEDLLDDADPLVRVDVVRALGELGDPRARPALRERLETDTDPRVKRRIREILRDLGETKRTADPLRDEIERLQAAHTSLKDRLTKIEALAAPKAPKKALRPSRPAAKKRGKRK
jgi:aminopeptidase N